MIDDKICPKCGADVSEIEKEENEEVIYNELKIKELDIEEKITYDIKKMNEIESRLPESDIINPKF